ncbi:N-acetylglutamate kinase [Desulforamulus reducens MI-1]|uniref:Acetylglutamate kinase n=1 Tax=Desulforamulus reducens (strain ATCC BAA-1160 / DSM 100696 / MI-1) TaxID=349161 RepID=ARGB_DESRM|nr:acetylglutamate kinase [Desulforamulus reducens]A4J169.1 RecName: Full=Acetylglutamate kinase; AltName: Full=N-acetyl-L-glutamate 5-phosphotransferase; AltName: Full=NAG kinase; Short=NAGK [Desulforamulus reducens MI-1]ABO48822.1 N-acetylglutamate kinase [Desulforamulus reducens MI-1]
MISPLEKAGILVEALPYIKKFSGKTIVIKYGGHAMLNADLKKAVMTDLVLMKFVGINPVVVHGGGPEITGMLHRLGIESQFVSGLRVTDAPTMEVVEMVLGKLNKEIVALINGLGGRSVGLSGKDANLIMANKKYSNDCQDIGFVGEVTGVNPQLLQTVIQEGYIPVVSPVGISTEGETYNINADTVASAIATALKADKLIILTDVEGILEDRQDKGTLISTVKMEDIPRLIERGVIQGGMIPKVECCMQAIQTGVATTHILDGRVPHSILLEVFTDKGIGTMVVSD